MKKYSLLFLSLCVLLSSSAQYVFTLDGASGTRVFAHLDSVMKYAQDGDYLFLPGASISAPEGFSIKRRLHVIGAGHYPDSTMATGQSVITGNVQIWSEGSGSVLQGISINGDIVFGVDPASAAAKNILISRCNVNSIHLSEDGTTYRGAENVVIKDNVIREVLNCAYVKNVVVESNIVEGYLAYGDGQIIFRNNIMLRRVGNMLNNIRSCRLENNIFLGSGAFFYGNCAGNVFYNNVFREGDPLGGAFSVNNQFNVTNLFVNQSGNIFSYTHNYHLNADSPAKGAGMAGTDCGIYGGVNPYKEGAVPINPHVRNKILPASTDGQGKLNVQVTVAAQNN